MDQQARNRGEAVIMLFFVIVLVAAPIASVFHSDVRLDAVRWFVIAQALIVLALYFYALGVGVIGLLREYRDPAVNRIAKQLRLARIASILMTILLVGEQIYQIINFRLGQHHLDARTPILQVALILALATWGWMHLRTFRPERRSTEGNVARLVEVVAEAQEKK